ncbi:MAG: bifunctional diguanylate cyclase/phosphodiesterase [Idiomarina sp.]|nr:bifunctional diguanylate cyclase/phosphodiesterase [Idiomarina sp.]
MQLTNAAIATASYAGQAILMLGFSLLLLHYFRIYRRPYLRFWSYATAYYSLATVSACLRVGGEEWFALAPKWVQFLTQTHLALLYVALILLCIGVFDITRHQPPRRPIRWLLYFSAAVLSFATLLPIPENIMLLASRPFLQDGLMFLITGVGLISISLLILRFAPAMLGPRLIATALGLQGIKNIGLTFLVMNNGELMLFELMWAMQGFLNLVFLSVAALGVTIWLLESERHEALDALQKADFLNRHDSLTKLPNRDEVMTKMPLFIDACRVNGRHLSIMMIGVDRFKAINDTLGMRGGDRVLVEITQRLQQLPAKPLLAARISGDVFLLVFDHLKRLSLIEDLALSIHAQLQHPMLIDGRELSVTCSFGISRYPQHGSRTEGLLSKANIALANAKLSHNPSIMLYQRGMDEHYIRLADLEPELRRAIQQNEFFIQLQPIYSGRRRNLACFEALIRWHHPTRGLLGPGEFLPYAEQLGMAGDVDSWVLEHCAALIARWRKEGERTVPIAVNLSARQFQNNELIAQMRHLLSAYDLKAADIELEITENVAVSDITTGLNVLRELQTMGFRIAIDDFGTGYSSLAYLRRLPIDRIKIDRSFVAEMLDSPGNTIIVRTLIQLSHGLNKNVIAEGVESHEQLATLLDLGCDAAQGYLLSPPVDEASARELLRKHWQDWGKVHFQLVTDR